jgi:hypothetical protein
MDFTSFFKKSFGAEENKEKSGGFDKKAQRIAATGLAVSASLGALLGGVSLIIFSLKNIHVYLELRKDRKVAEENSENAGVFGTKENILHKQYH